MIKLVLSLVVGAAVVAGVYGSEKQPPEKSPQTSTAQTVGKGSNKADNRTVNLNGRKNNFNIDQAMQRDIDEGSDNTLVVILSIVAVLMGAASSVLALLIFKKLSGKTIEYTSGRIMKKVDLFEAVGKTLAAGSGKSDDGNASAISDKVAQSIRNDFTNVRTEVQGIQNQVAASLSNSQNTLENISVNLSNMSINLNKQLAALQSGSAEDMRNYVAQITRLFGEDAIRALQDYVAQIRENLESIKNQQPELVKCMIDNAAEIFSACQTTGFTSADAIRSAGEYKEYYSHRQEHEQIAAEKASLDAGNRQLTAENANLKEALQQANSSAAAANSELAAAQSKLNELQKQNSSLEDSLRILRPENINMDALYQALDAAGEEERAAAVTSFCQLYWYAKAANGNARNIKAVFSKFDNNLYELFENKAGLLENIRQALVEAINKQIFAETNYTVLWPQLGSNASEHEEWYTRENDEGNRICKVRSAVVMNNGNVESVARIYTEM